MLLKSVLLALGNAGGSGVLLRADLLALANAGGSGVGATLTGTGAGVAIDLLTLFKGVGTITGAGVVLDRLTLDNAGLDLISLDI